MVGKSKYDVMMAAMFAAGAHAAVGQRRKFTNEPYIAHPYEVARIVETAPHTVEMLQAAYLHDVVEDTAVTLDVIDELFGSVVASYVNGLTNISVPSDGNRARRKEIDRLFLAQQCAEVQTIKLADLISNTTSIVSHDKKFAAVYLAEKRDLLSVLTKGDEELQMMAHLTLIAGLKELETQ